MAITITPEEVYFGSPTTLTYGGVDVGATETPPTLHFDITKWDFKPENAAGPIKGASVVTDIIVRVELVVNQMTGAKLAWALPGAVEAAGVVTWSAGRVPTSAYKDLVLVGAGLDGRTMTVTLEDAFSAENLSIELGKSNPAGLAMNFMGYYDPTTPNTVPVTIEFSEGS